MDTKEKSTLPATIGRTIFGLVVTAVLLLIICGGLHFMVKAAQNAGVCESIWQAVGYGFAALGCIAGVYIVLLVYYTKCCHTTGRKVFMVAMVIVMAFAVRFSLQMYAGVLEAAANAENGGVFDAGAGFIEALYGTFGGLTFEGMDPLIEGGGVLAGCQLATSYAYSGVAVLAALFFYTAVSLSVDYPMSCAVAAWLRRTGDYLLPRKCRCDVYIFDSVTEDTVLLAEDIVRTYATSDTAIKKLQKARRQARMDWWKVRLRTLIDRIRDALSIKNKNGAGVSEQPKEKPDFKFMRNEIKDSIAWYRGAKKRCRIVFIGRDMRPFERRDQLHRRLMANGFLYLRYDFGRDMREVKRKGESSACRGVLADFIKSARNIHFFAFSRNDDFKEQFGKKYKSEQVNFRTVTEEIAALEAYSHRRRISRIPPKFHTPARICFYVLSEDDADHPTYDVRFEQWRDKFVSNENSRLAGVILDYKIINEAERATWKITFDQDNPDNNIVTNDSDGNWIEEYVKAAHEAYGSPEEPDKKAAGQRVGKKADIAVVTRGQNGEGVKKEKSILSVCNSYDDYIKKRDEQEVAGSEIEVKRILSLGFGDTARKTIGGLYVNNDGNMIVDVIDSRASSIMGGYMRSHPSVLCMRSKSPYSFKVKHGKIPNVVKKADSDKWWMYGYNNLLVVNYAELDGTGDTAAKYIDDSFGNRDPAQKENYDAFIIALGDDELNLDCFRNVMSDIRRELIDLAAGNGVDAIDPTKKLTIFVHLREKGNAARLYWDDTWDKELSPHLKNIRVKPYGAREDVYTYDEIVSDAEAIKMNYEYSRAAGWAGTKNRFELWNEQPEFGRWSSKAASTFFDTLYRLEKAAEWECGKIKIKNEEERRLICSRLSGVAEHRRWSRFHYINGFVKFPSMGCKGNEKLTLERKSSDQWHDPAKYNLVHRLLTSFSALGDAQANNDANGIVAKKCVEERDPKKTV